MTNKKTRKPPIKRSKVVLSGDEIIEQLEHKLNMSPREAAELFEVFFSEIKESVEKEKEVRLMQLGNFTLKKAGKYTVDFRPAPVLARRLITYHLAKEKEANA
jgi:integration host factor subunit alpha